jgi:hypothetical protein
VVRGSSLASGFTLVAALCACARGAHASTLDANGNFVFAPNALLTLGFESIAEGEAAGGSWLAWGSGAPTALSIGGPGHWTVDAGSSGVVSTARAIQGSSALELVAGPQVAFALVDSAFFARLSTMRVQVSFWGLSMGAEPELDVVYPSGAEPVGPDGFGRIVAIRTGRETSDGWAEYSTGPIDGQIFGNDPIGAILLAARFSTTDGDFVLGSTAGFSVASEPNAFALVDGVEIAPADGAPMPTTPCTEADFTSTCGSLGECAYGVCVDGALVWGAVPQAADHRSDLVNRWAFLTQHLTGNRAEAATATSVFSPAAISALSSATAPAAFYGGLNTTVNSLHDGHTSLGFGPSGGTAFYEALGSFESDSGLLDVCFGLATDDLPGGTLAPTYAIFWTAPESPVAGTLAPGDMLTAVDGLSPDAWLDAVGPRYRGELTDDPTSEPAGRALLLAAALAKYATTAVFSSCTADGECTTKTIPVGSIAFQKTAGTGFGATTTSSRICTGRFTDAVSTWGADDDFDEDDVPEFETVAGITSVEFNGFDSPVEAANAANPYTAWTTPISQAVASAQSLLFDVRLGHGGNFEMGTFLVHLLRGTASPFFALALPRGSWDTADPSWLFDPSFATCEAANYVAPDLCGWTGGLIDGPTGTGLAAAVKVAWVNGNDLSMNDIAPHDLLGMPNFRIFGPHPTNGGYGARSDLPPLVAGWSSGSLPAQDSRFGSSFDTAIAAPWASGTGVPPDEVVLQTISDALAGRDTVLAAARAWLDP